MSPDGHGRPAARGGKCAAVRGLAHDPLGPQDAAGDRRTPHYARLTALCAGTGVGGLTYRRTARAGAVTAAAPARAPELRGSGQEGGLLAEPPSVSSDFATIR